MKPTRPEAPGRDTKQIDSDSVTTTNPAREENEVGRKGKIFASASREHHRTFGRLAASPLKADQDSEETSTLRDTVLAGIDRRVCPADGNIFELRRLDGFRLVASNLLAIKCPDYADSGALPKRKIVTGGPLA